MRRIVLLLAVSAVLAQTDPPKATLRGVVKSTGVGLPVEGASVFFFVGTQQLSAKTDAQ
jgi:hypothetical protein